MKVTKLPNGGQIEESFNGNKRWYLNSKLHREDGPAIEYAYGEKHWCLNGKLHREDGPAVEYANGNKSWYINNIKLPCRTQEQFERLMKLKAFW
jgi:hypothetical protein